ncbi:MAG: DNA repair protein RecO [Acidimicrobiia bacterium]|nr:DNA repair protein RecO [Acidimicrobiia bacterium]
MALYRDQGVILRTWKLGEADRILNILTRGNGKVRAVAKGVRKTRSKFGARLEPSSHVQLQLYGTRGDLDIVTQVESIDRFPDLRDDFDRFGRASAMLEAVDQLAQEREVNEALYLMLVRALRTLSDLDSPLVVAGFFWKVLALEGFEPFLDACVSCHQEGPLVAFDLDTGGALCTACRRGRALSPAALELLQLILGGQLGEALARPTTAATAEVDHLATDAMEHHLERRLRSLGVLGQG